MSQNMLQNPFPGSSRTDRIQIRYHIIENKESSLELMSRQEFEFNWTAIRMPNRFLLTGSAKQPGMNLKAKT